MTIKFNAANAKISKLAKYLDDPRRKVYSFDLPAGRSCPSAHLCKARAILDQATGKRSVKDGPFTIFRCYAASDEARFPAVYEGRKNNLETLLNLGSREAMANALHMALPLDAGIVRIHTSGDFFNAEYFAAWVAVARANPHVTFYAYTKELQHMIPANAAVYFGSEGKPQNLRLTASRGGRQDHAIDEYGMPEAVVVYSEEEALGKGLEVDTDDSHAMLQNGSTSFALVIHGTQPKGSEAQAAVTEIRRQARVAKITAEESRKPIA